LQGRDPSWHVSPVTAARQTILIFDSGLGGLTVYREVATARPDADYVYVADDAAFPYGAKPEAELVARIVALMGELIAAHRPELIVVACNTASTIALPALRERFAEPFVGTVPAIKPACAGSTSRRVSVLGTEATVAREYTRALIRDYAGDCEVTLVGSKNLAAYAEAELAGSPTPDSAVAAEIAPCFRENGARTDTVVLACTHYPLIVERLRRLAPWPVSFIDPAPAIARRVVSLLGVAPAEARIGTTRAIFTSGRAPSGVLRRFGIHSGEPAATGAA
jgi:glutamate racemase